MDKQLLSDRFIHLVGIMDELRAKCPWDQKQTIQSLSALTIEEVYELTDAIDKQDWSEIKGELGDLLLHILFYSKIGQEKDKFNILEVIETISLKMITRHPHIYGNVQVNNEQDVKKNWQMIKLKQGKDSVLSGVPNGLPAVIKAARIQEKVSQVGFDWENKSDVWLKVEEELSELKQAVESDVELDIEEEFGDVLFSLINYARFLKVDPEAALQKTNRKFMNRFQQMEILIKNENQVISEMNLEELDIFWEKAKHILSNKI